MYFDERMSQVNNDNTPFYSSNSESDSIEYDPHRHCTKSNLYILDTLFVSLITKHEKMLTTIN